MKKQQKKQLSACLEEQAGGMQATKTPTEPRSKRVGGRGSILGEAACYVCVCLSVLRAELSVGGVQRNPGGEKIKSYDRSSLSDLEVRKGNTYPGHRTKKGLRHSEGLRQPSDALL
ncbi:hypothetical protein Pcinc_037530 [Petrolisthes cinctipes]|uniref:Uncharacterized protein n=1 Tax=Petrolisthes cinctipes TaxID=88211 RepID=A0AAE1EKW6_PETCI|nr:hypothetical protein Pcinc_037530 [Petrolisthes cinctipes]